MTMLKTFFMILIFSLKASAKTVNESEIGIASANGNTRSESYNLKQQSEIKWKEKNILTFKGRYLNSSAEGKETGRYFMASLRYENQVSARVGFFGGETLEKDRFANIDQRLISDVGGKYRFIETELSKFFGELGYRYMDEQRRDGSSALNSFGRVYTEWENKWNSNFTTKLWFEYLPNFSVPKDWMANAEASLTTILSDIFSLKTGLLLRYDHLPAPGTRYNSDTLFTTALVAKF